MNTVTFLAGVVAIVVILFLFTLKINCADLGGERERYKIFGNAAQIVSAFGTLLFGITSILVAISVGLLQQETRRDAEIGRVSDLLAKAEENKIKNFDDYVRAGSCISFLTRVLEVKSETDFETYILQSAGAPRNTHFLIKESVIDENVAPEQLSDCLTVADADGTIKIAGDTVQDNDNQKRSQKFYIFYRRLAFGLNYFESVLFNWSSYSVIEARREISEQIVEQVCEGPIRNFFTKSAKSKKLNSLLLKTFPKLVTFTKRCDYELAAAARGSPE